MSSRRSGAIPSPWSMTRISAVPPRRLVATRTRLPGGEWRAALARTFTSTRCSSTGSACSGGRSGSRASSTSSGPSASSSTAASTASAESTGASDTASTPACTRLTSSRSVTSVESVARLSSAVASSSARSSGDRLRARGAEAADRGHRGGERTPEVVAHGRQQRRAHLVGLGEHAGLARRLGELEVLERRLELGDDDVERDAAPRHPARRRAARGSRAARPRVRPGGG